MYCFVVGGQVEVMRRLLLTQVGVREFSDDGMFKDFCRSVCHVRIRMS